MSDLFIGGSWTSGRGDELVSVNPALSTISWRGTTANREDVDEAVASAREGFELWSRMDLQDRLTILRSFRDILDQRSDEFAEAITEETGKPRWETPSEVRSMIAKVDISIDAHSVRTGERIRQLDGGITSATRHRPHGVLAVFGPYNFPGHLPNGHIVPALIAGNSIVFKPSELTPHVGAMMTAAWAQAGLPAGVLNLVQGGRPTGEHLAGHDGIDGILFTGSARTGAAIHAQLAGRPDKLLALEMGGNNPMIVGTVDDEAATVRLIIESAFLTAGQRCTCTRRLLVAEGPAGDQLVDRLVRTTANLRIDHPTAAPQPFHGPVISASAASSLLDSQQQLIELGAHQLLPMARLDHGPAFVSPGILDGTGVLHLPDEEYFGPLLTVLRYRTFDDAVSMANNTRFGLAAGLLSTDRRQYEEFRKKIRAGIVNWNRPTTGASSAAPFGGIGASGNHRPSAYYAADYCSYPVASLEQDSLVQNADEPPGYPDG